MSGEARKLHLIEAILKTDDEALLKQVENLLVSINTDPIEKKRPEDFAGIWTDEEAAKMKKYIEEGCEQIDPDEWK